MIGDAPGDYEAAAEAGVMFYPIIPGKENECWKNLGNVYFEMFVNGRYDKALETRLYGEFTAFLKGEK